MSGSVDLHLGASQVLTKYLFREYTQTSHFQSFCRYTAAVLQTLNVQELLCQVESVAPELENWGHSPAPLDSQPQGSTVPTWGSPPLKLPVALWNG